jgi:hypothetical protein
VRREGLAVHLERHVSGLAGREESAQVTVQLRRWHHHCRRRRSRRCAVDVLGVNLRHHGQVAPDGEAVVLEMPRLFQLVPLNESPESPAAVGEGFHLAGGQGTHRLPAMVEEAEPVLCFDALKDVVVELEKEGDVVGPVRSVSVGVVEDVPAVASDAEGSGLDVAAGRDVLGAGVAGDLQQVLAALRARDDGGGGPRRLFASASAGHCRHGRINENSSSFPTVSAEITASLL